jgi:hypothetical protein
MLNLVVRRETARLLKVKVVQRRLVLNTEASISESKSEDYQRHACSGTKGRRIYVYTSSPFASSALEGSGWSTPCPRRFTPRTDPAPILQEDGWVSGPVWTYTYNFSPTRIRSPKRPVHTASPNRPPFRTIHTLTFKNRASYIQGGRTATLQMLHFIYFFNEYKYWVF